MAVSLALPSCYQLSSLLHDSVYHAGGNMFTKFQMHIEIITGLMLPMMSLTCCLQ